MSVEGRAYEPGWIVDDPVTVLDGELLAPGVVSGPCAFEQWYADGWYRWRCTAPDHQGTGEDRTETGRAAALRRHAEYVERERAAGAMTGYVPVKAHRHPGLSDLVLRYAMLPIGAPVVDELAEAVAALPAPHATSTARLVVFIDRPEGAPEDWWRGPGWGAPQVGAPLDIVDVTVGEPGRPMVVVDVAPVDGGGIRVVAEG